MFKKSNPVAKQTQHKKKGQSTLEYIILVTAVVAILLAFLAPGGIFRGAVQNTFQQGTNGMENMAGRLAGSHQ